MCHVDPKWTHRMALAVHEGANILYIYKLILGLSMATSQTLASSRSTYGRRSMKHVLSYLYRN